MAPFLDLCLPQTMAAKADTHSIPLILQHAMAGS